MLLSLSGVQVDTCTNQHLNRQRHDWLIFKRR